MSSAWMLELTGMLWELEERAHGKGGAGSADCVQLNQYKLQTEIGKTCGPQPCSECRRGFIRRVGVEGSTGRSVEGRSSELRFFLNPKKYDVLYKPVV
ncbi:hypothetical protein CRUP_017470 [Coryphaenoides rupestris]|nr:hypothetical protein CRUP_017470 [Coryphaenoides rupestris]